MIGQSETCDIIDCSFMVAVLCMITESVILRTTTNIIVVVKLHLLYIHSTLVPMKLCYFESALFLLQVCHVAVVKITCMSFLAQVTFAKKLLDES